MSTSGSILRIQARRNRIFSVTRLGRDVVEVDLRQGEWVILHTGTVPRLTMGPVAIGDHSNYWGTLGSTPKLGDGSYSTPEAAR